MNSYPHLITQVGFGLVTIIFFYLLLSEIKKALAKSSIEEIRQKRIFKNILACLLIWIAFVSGGSISGKMGDFTMFPFNLMPVLIIPLIATILLTFSKTFGEIIMHVPQENLIRLQSFRIFVEILLWALFIENLAPVQMTFEGRNFDILSGLTALLLAYWVSKQSVSKPVIIVWNLICLGLLINIVAVAILSMPTSFRTFMNEPSNTIVTQFPISLLPGLLVPLAYSLHFFSLRQLSIRK